MRFPFWRSKQRQLKQEIAAHLEMAKRDRLGRGASAQQADADAASSAQRVALISKTTAERFWPGKSPIGEHFKPRWLTDWWTVVGVVGNVREYSMSQDLAEWVNGEIYTPYGAHSILGSGPERPPAELTLVIRTSEQETRLGGQLQAIASSLNGDVPVTQVETMNGWLRDVAAGSRSTASLFSVFAAIAVGAGRGGNLRRDLLLGGATHARNRHSHGHGRATPGSSLPDHGPRRVAGDLRRCGWLAGRIVADAVDVEPALRRGILDVRRRGAAAGVGRGRRLLDPRTPRHARRSRCGPAL
jgi:hypothetical protein